MADTLRQLRGLLIDIAVGNPERFIFDQSGFINESALAEVLRVRASTVHRILRLERNLKSASPPDYFPTQKLLQALMPLVGARDEGEVIKRIRRQREHPPDVLKRLIRPRIERAPKRN